MNINCFTQLVFGYPVQDVAGDGTAQDKAAKDILSFALHYYNQTLSGNTITDYKPIGNINNSFALLPSQFAGNSLYNGNIAAMSEQCKLVKSQCCYQ